MIDLLSLIAMPLAVGMIATISHTVLGRHVLARGIVFIDLAIAQCAALGLLIGAVLGLHGLEQTLAGVIAAMVGAAGVAGLCEIWPARREALIGLLYVGCASMAIVVASVDPHGLQRVSQLLAGDPLWVTGAAIVPLLMATVPFIWVTFRHPGWLDDGRFFYPIFALLISLSLPLLGLYLVFATLIVPALIAENLPGRALPAAIALGALGHATGLAASAVFDLPSGPSIVVTMVLLAILPVWIGSRAARIGSAKDSEAA